MHHKYVENINEWIIEINKSIDNLIVNQDKLNECLDSDLEDINELNKSMVIIRNQLSFLSQEVLAIKQSIQNNGGVAHANKNNIHTSGRQK